MLPNHLNSFIYFHIVYGVYKYCLISWIMAFVFCFSYSLLVFGDFLEEKGAGKDYAVILKWKSLIARFNFDAYSQIVLHRVCTNLYITI